MPALTCSRPSIAGIAVATLLAGAAAATGAAPADPALLGAANAAQPAVIASLKDMVLIESGSTDAAGLAKMAGYVEARLQALGARTERIAPARGPGYDGQGQLQRHAARRKLMLIAHMDTVYPAGTLASEPYRQDGNKLYGPGIADDKGGIAVILHSLAILKDAGWRDYAQLTVLFNHDEEVGSTTRARPSRSSPTSTTTCSRASRPARRRSRRPRACCSAPPARRPRRWKSRAARRTRARRPRPAAMRSIELAYQLQQTRDIAKGIPGRAAQLDDGAGGRGPQPDPGEGDAPAPTSA